MKGIDIFCASPASTAVCNRRSDMGRRRRGHRPIDDRDHGSKVNHAPCSSQLPILPQPTYNYKFHHEKSRKSTDGDNPRGKSLAADVRKFKRSSSTPHGDSSRYLLSDHTSPGIHDFLSGFDEGDDGKDDDGDLGSANTCPSSLPPARPKLASSLSTAPNKSPAALKLSSSSSARELPKQRAGLSNIQSPALKSSSSTTEMTSKQAAVSSGGKLSVLKSCSSAREIMVKQTASSGDFPALKSSSSARERPKQKEAAGSTEFRALKSHGSAGGHVAGLADQFLALKSSSSARQVMSSKQQESSSHDSSATNKSCSSAGSRDQQVVELRVSIHCKGCEGKVRKHISKMEGVTSFSIDMATKKVIVIGDVTASGVLASVSRVKNARLWPSSSPLLPPAAAATHHQPSICSS